MLRVERTIASEFADDNLKDGAYHEYSDQFLDSQQRQELSSHDNPVQLRADLLCKSGKDPFSPPLNSLEQSRRAVDPKRVEKCFERAHQIYRGVIEETGSEPARLYKLNWSKDQTKTAYSKLRKIWGDIQKARNGEEFQKCLDEIKKSSDADEQMIFKALFENKDEIIKIILDNPVLKNRAVALGAAGTMYEKIRENIKKQASYPFFKSTKDYKGLQQCFAIYDPKDDGKGNITHSWGTNLTWALAHIKRSNKFIVCSDVLSNQARTGYPDTPSAFAREICVALKAGYTLCKTKDGITLQPIGLSEEHLKSCDSTGVLGDGVNPSHEEVDQIYRLLKGAKWDEQQDYQCFFNFQGGVVELRELTQVQMQAVQEHQQSQIEPSTSINARLSQALGSLGDFSRNTTELLEEPTVFNQLDSKFSDQRQALQSVNDTNNSKSGTDDPAVATQKNPKPRN